MLIFGAIGFLIVRKKSKRVKIVSVMTGVLLPIIGMLSLIDFFFVMVIAGTNFERNFIFIDRFDVPLHNNYQWTAFEEMDNGVVIYNKVGTDGGVLNLIPNDEAFWNVLEIQEQGDWLAGSISNNSSQEQKPDDWFLFNTRTHQNIGATSEQELRVDAAEKGIQLHLQPCREFYLSRHFSWVAVLEIILLLVLPVIGLGLLWKLAVKFVAKDNQRPVLKPG